MSFPLSRSVSCCGFVATAAPIPFGLLMTLSDGILMTVLGWLLVALTLVILVGVVRVSLTRPSVLEVSPEGLTMNSAKAGMIPWSAMLDVRSAEESENGFIEIAVSDAEADRQADALSRVTRREREDGSTARVLWVSSAVRASEPALGAWLAREVEACRAE